MALPDIIVTAAEAGAEDGVMRWLDGGGDIEAQEEKTGTPLLMLASCYGREELVERLLERGADVDVQNVDGFTALIYAVGQGHLRVVRRLLRAGARTDLTLNDGMDAIHWAYQWCNVSGSSHMSIIEALEDQIKANNRRSMAPPDRRVRPRHARTATEDGDEPPAGAVAGAGAGAGAEPAPQPQPEPGTSHSHSLADPGGAAGPGRRDAEGVVV